MQFEEFCAMYGVSYRTSGKHCTHGRVNVDCPNCGDVNQFHLGWHVSRTYFHCWKCGKRPIVDTLMRLARISRAEASNIANALERKLDLGAIEHTGEYAEPWGVGELLPVHRAYLRSRGMTDADIKMWGLRGIGMAPKLDWRIFVPITYRREPVSWTTRALSPDVQPRYISDASEQEAIPHKTILFGADLATHTIVICEGPFDAMRIGAGAVATCGTSYTQAQMTHMLRFPVRAVCLDAEPAAQKRAQALVDALAAFDGETSNIILDSGDPGEASIADVNCIRKHFHL